MGTAASKSIVPGTPDDLVIHVVSVHNVPKEIIRHSDPYLKLSLLDSKNKVKGVECDTLYFPETEAATYNSFRNLKAISNDEEDTLQVDLYDWDRVGSADKYGTVKIPMKNITNEQKEFEFILEAATSSSSATLPNPTVILRRVPGSIPVKKTIFVIRHGESAWNEAQEHKDLKGMVEQVDHPLNEIGIKQARDFNALWKKASSSLSDIQNEEERELVRLFLSANGLYASPLTRTVQTALLTLQNHPTLSAALAQSSESSESSPAPAASTARGLKLLRNLREIKKLGGLDTVGQCIDEHIRKRTGEELVKVLGDEESTHLIYRDIVIDYNDARQRWWSSKATHDTKLEISSRIDDWLHTVRHDDFDVGIFVGHSLYFKQICKHFVSESLKKSNKDLVKKMASYKMKNAACLALELDFSSGMAQITKCVPMFGTGFEEGKH